MTVISFFFFFSLARSLISIPYCGLVSAMSLVESTSISTTSTEAEAEGEEEEEGDDDDDDDMEDCHICFCQEKQQ